ncbi:MAG TPA: DUF1684 domain-containing protein [Propionibacteriaceae bacterium]|nr:DUF1684 domain-containing protein [Propionibacteriaceae bacterium]
MSESRWQVLDWRRRTATLYEAVRDTGNPRVGHALWVQGRELLLRHHPASPVPVGARDAYAGPSIAPYDGDYRFEVEVDRAVPETRRDVPTATDGVVPFELVGRVTLPGLGALDVWWAAVYGGGVFLPLKDATSGTASYGGGRYVVDTVKGADLGGGPDSLVVDLNFAYQPSCAYDDAWACPLPGPGNTLGVPVPVGELSGPSRHDSLGSRA